MNLKINDSGLLVELLFQHRTKGYANGYSIILFSEEAVHLIEYLKSFGYWYPASEPTGGVEILPNFKNFIEKYVFQRNILDIASYEIIVSFIDEKDFPIYFYRGTKIALLSAYFRGNSQFAHSTILTRFLLLEKIIPALSIQTFPSKLSTEHFELVRRLNNNIDGAPLEIDSSLFEFRLELRDIDDFIVDGSFDEGFPDDKVYQFTK